MSGYIGKISAVVTANTSDLSRKLQGAVKDVDRFAQTLNRSVSASAQQATASLEKIFTPLQRLERRLQTALQLNLRTDDEVRKIQQLVSVAEGINKPLERASGAFSRLSLEVQGSFLPALNRAQDAAVNLSNTLQQQGSVSASAFKQVEQVVDRTTQAIQRLTQAQQLASQSLTGNELQFGNPRLFETLSANARTTQRAAALPASALVDGDIARQVRALEQYQNAAVEAAARVESLRLEPNVRPDVVLAAERRLESIIETARRAGREVETSVANARGLFTVTNARPESAGLGLFGTQAGTAEQRALAKARELSAEFAKLPDSAQRGLSGLAAIAANLANRVDQGKASAEQLEAVLARLQARIEAASPAAALARANAQLTIAPDQPSPPSPSTPLGNRLAQSGAERIRGLTGNLNIDSTPVPGVFNEQAQRDIDALAGRVGQVRQQLESLPNSVRTQFIPALQQAAAQLTALQNSPAATAEQIERATTRVRQLEDAADRARQALSIPDSNRLLQGFSTRQAVGELEAFSQILARIGAQAGGPAAQAYDRYAEAVRRAVTTGTAGLPLVRRELERLQVEAAEAAAATGRINFNTALRQIQRGGDVARGAFGGAGLAIQQAVFAVDDFFSVTGDLSQRIRAAGNNISQLGFILGGTTGLIAGVSIAITGQLVAALIRWANGGRTAEDQAKALNDALSRQKSTVDDLSQSIRSLSDSLTDNVFSKLNGDIRSFEESVARLEKRLAEARGDRSAASGRFDGSSTPPLVRRQGTLFQSEADLQRIDRELQAATDPVQAALLARQRRERSEAVNRARAAFGSAATPSRDDLSAILLSAAGQRLGLNARDRGAIFRDRLALPQGIQLRTLGQSIPAGEDVSARRRQLAALREAEGILAPIVEATRSDPRSALGGQFLGDVTAEFERLQQAIVLLERDISAAADQGIVSALGSIRRSGESLSRDIGRLESAVAANVTGAVQELSAREEIGLRLRAAAESLNEASSIEDAPARQDAVNKASAEVQQIEAAIKARQGEVNAILSSQSSISTFADALDRVSTQLANTVAQEARGLADQARRDANLQQGVIDAGLGGRQADADAAAQRRDRLAAEAAEFQRQAAEVAANNARARIDFERQAQAGGLGREAQDLIRRRNAAQAVIDNQASPAAAVVDAQATLNVINTELQQIFERSGAGQAAAKLADELNKAAAAAARRDELIQRGRELDLSPAEQAGRELAEDIRAIQERLAADLPAGIDADVARIIAAEGVDSAKREAGLLRREGRNEAADLLEDAAADIARVREESFRSTAPAIFGLADAVQNAILQGPSRAALEATDVSTVEGARELNRLLRGDDSARDQNLVELQKQSQILERIARGVEDPAQVAN